MNAADQLARKLTKRSIDLLRVAADTNRSVRALLVKAQAEIVGRLAQTNLSASTLSRLKAVQRDVEELINNTYGGITDLVATRMTALATIEAAATASAINGVIGIEIVSGTLPAATLRALFSNVMIQGAPSSTWWSRQSADLIFRFVQQVRLGMMQGETNAQLIQRIRGGIRAGETLPGVPGLLDKSYAEAAALVRTSVQTVLNTATKAVFDGNPEVIKGYSQLSTLDLRTTDVCIAYDGASWDMQGNPLPPSKLPFNGGPPRHFGCRSRLIPILKSWEEMGSKIRVRMPDRSRASMDGAVPASLTYQDWFGGLTEAQQNEALGKGKATLWREGKITMRSLLDQSARPMTLAQLEARA